MENFNLEEQKKLLLDKKILLEKRIAVLTEEKKRKNTPISADFAEQAQETENDEVIDRLEQQDLTEFNAIVTALARIEAGTYTTCQSCGEPIAPKRLSAVPYAVLCVQCANESL